MICYLDTEDPVECPYCKSTEDCDHLLALYDYTFDSIEGGYLFDETEIHSLLYDFFQNLIKLNGFEPLIPAFEKSPLGPIYYEIIDSKAYYLDKGHFTERDFYMPAYYRYMFDRLDDITLPEIGEFDGGPGQSSFYRIYYTDNIFDVLAKLKDSVKADISRLNLPLAEENE